MTMLAKKIRFRLLPGTGEKVEAERAPVEEAPPSIVDIIDNVLERRTHKLSFFRPSMFHGCDRANVFHYLNAPHHPSRQNPRMMRILDNGTAIHEVIQGYLADHPDWWFAKESRIYEQVEGAWIRGSCDGVLIRRSDGYKVGIEIKTTSHDQWMKLTKPKEEHIMQASIYAKLQGLRWIVVIYWDKGTQDLKEFPVQYKASLWDSSRERVRYLKGFVDRGEIPRYDPAQCDKSFCMFVEHCRRKGAPV